MCKHFRYTLYSPILEYSLYQYNAAKSKFSFS